MDSFTCLKENHDDIALGSRTPVILIHGLHGNGPTPQSVGGTNDEYFSRLIAHLNSNAAFRDRFKLYRFHYRSDFQPVYQIARSLRNWIDDFVKRGLLPENRKFVLIAHSMGGLVARSYMNEHDTDFGPTFQGQRGGKRIQRLITLATPHHGSVGANGLARTFGHDDWTDAFTVFDFVYWTYQNKCALCGVNPAQPNRSDLRFDNFNDLWKNNLTYLISPLEKNDWLINMPKTYDPLISAYYGYIGGHEAVAAVGQLCPVSLGEYFRINQDNNFATQIGSGVLLTRIELNNFGTPGVDCGSPIFFLNNDGLVTTDSGTYKQANVKQRVQCGGYNHEDMKDGRGGNCTVVGTSIRKPLFDLVIDDLLSIPTTSSDNQAPSASITSPTSNSTFSTGSNSINLAGSASDNVGVTRVTWTNSRGGSGVASGTNSWSINGVSLQGGTNTITVSAQDAAGNIGTDTLAVTYSTTISDISPPSVKITSPTSASTYSTTGSTLTLRGTATDNIGVTQVTWSNSRGGSGTASGTLNWTANVTGLQSGTNVLTVRARDAAGNSSTATLTVTYSPPPICDGGTSENYRVNGGPPLHPNGTLIKQRNDPTVYLIQNGQKRGIPTQTILNGLYQQPNGGFQFKDVVTIAADEFTRYPTGTVINSALPSNGRSHPDGRLIQRVGGSEISIVTNGGIRRPFASESTFLGLGYLYCNVVPASDYDSYPAGIPVDATTTLNISVTPTSQQTRDWGGSVTYTFTVTDGNGTPVSGAAVGGQDNLRGIGVFLATPSTDGNGQGTYTTTVPSGAANGVYDIMFRTDKAGYTGSGIVTRQVEVSHFQDIDPPAVSVTSPTANSFFSTGASPITLSGSATDNVGVTQVTWTNDRAGGGNASGTNNWTASGIPLQEGANVLTITARDAAGNIGTAILTVNYTPAPTDTTPPTIVITSPTTQLIHQTSVSPITLSGSASDNSGVTQVVWASDRGSTGTASGTTSWTAAGIPLQAGFNVLTVIARDASGNIGTATIIVNLITPSVDTSGPALVVNSPSVGQTVTTNSITVSGTATDAGLGANGVSSVTVNGVRADGDTASGAGIANWSRNITLSPGANSIIVVAKDNSPAQNPTTRALTIHYQPARRVKFDYDGDGRSDVAVWRKSDGNWYISNSSNGTSRTVAWGSQSLGDVPVAGDFDGDGRVDVAVWRASTGAWLIQNSSNGASRIVSWGSQSLGDTPVPGDYDGDRRTDVAVWRASTGAWLIQNSSNGTTQSHALGNQSLGDVPAPADFDGDGRTDPAVWRASTGTWHGINSANGAAWSTQWGAQQLGDVPVASDYDGDGRADLAVWRKTTGAWIVLNSANGASRIELLGDQSLGDVPVPADYDGDGRSDLAVWRASTGVWHLIHSANGAARMLPWGSQSAGDVPLPAPASAATPPPLPFNVAYAAQSGDFDNDGKTDFVVWRRSNGTWYINNSSNNASTSRQWGAQSLGDMPVPGDYDGDGRADVAVWRASTGTWYIHNSETGTTTTREWGSQALGDVPVAADYDGDDRADVAVWRASTGTWYIRNSTTGTLREQAWGTRNLGDVPVPGDYDGDGNADLAVWRASAGTWHILNSSTGVGRTVLWGSQALGDVPVPADYDNDGRTDVAVWRASNGTWYVSQSSTGATVTRQWGVLALGDVPVLGDFDGDGRDDFAVWRASNGMWHVSSSATGTNTSKQWGAQSLGDTPASAAYVIVRSSGP